MNFTFFVPCIVTQLCNVNQQYVHIFFKFNVLIQFYVSSTCFENHVFIISKKICTCSLVWYVFMRLCKQSSSWMYRAHPPARLLTYMHEKHTIKNCMYKWSSWWWTRDARNMQKTRRTESKH